MKFQLAYKNANIRLRSYSIDLHDYRKKIRKFRTPILTEFHSISNREQNIPTAFSWTLPLLASCVAFTNHKSPNLPLLQSSPSVLYAIGPFSVNRRVYVDRMQEKEVGVGRWSGVGRDTGQGLGTGTNEGKGSKVVTRNAMFQDL